MKIYCNKCHKELTEYEKLDYPIIWQFSGDMYCSKHKIREWETHRKEKK